LFQCDEDEFEGNSRISDQPMEFQESRHYSYFRGTKTFQPIQVLNLVSYGSDLIKNDSSPNDNFSSTNSSSNKNDSDNISNHKDNSCIKSKYHIRWNPYSPKRKEKNQFDRSINTIKNNSSSNKNNSNSNKNNNTILHFNNDGKTISLNPPSQQQQQLQKNQQKIQMERHMNHFTHFFPDIGISKRDLPKSEKKWACPVPSCPKGYTRVSDLRSHFTLQHANLLPEYPDLQAEGKFVCKFCGINFARRKILSRHINKEHLNNCGQTSKESNDNNGSNSRSNKNSNDSNGSDSNSNKNSNDSNTNTISNMIVDETSEDDSKKSSENKTTIDDTEKSDDNNDNLKDNKFHTGNRFSIDFLVK